MHKRISGGLLTVTLACGSGGQSGTDQFDVGRVTPVEATDAGVETPEPISLPPEPVPPPEPIAPAQLPEIQQLCDGSDGIRFSAVFGTGGGPVAYYNAFLPGTFLAIDGTCRYWVNDSSLSGLRSGVLGVEEAQAYAVSLHYGRYAVLSDYEANQCPDSGITTLTDATGSLACRCGLCDFGSEPAELREAIATAVQLSSDVGSRQEWAWGPSSFLAVLTTESAELPWTLDLDLAEVAYDSALQPFANDAGVLVEDPDQLMLLSALRQGSIDGGEAWQLFVTQDGNGYALYVRDEPPAEILDALSADKHH
jgi:hypothetical protein